MKTILRIILFISLALNIYFLISRYIANRDKQDFLETFNNPGNPTHGFTEFYTEITKNEIPEKRKEYFYVNIWETWCKPCVAEMPYLDSLAGKVSEKISCVFVSANTDKANNTFLERKNIQLKHMVVKNNMKNFIAWILSQNKQLKGTYPLHVILNKEGKVLYLRAGAAMGNDILLVNEFRKLDAL